MLAHSEFTVHIITEAHMTFHFHVTVSQGDIDLTPHWMHAVQQCVDLANRGVESTIRGCRKPDCTVSLPSGRTVCADGLYLTSPR